MKITVIEGSPHLRGASSTIASRFIDGAREAGLSLIHISEPTRP